MVPMGTGEKIDQIEFTEPYLFSHGALITHHHSLIDTLKSFRSYIWSKEMVVIFLAMFIRPTERRERNEPGVPFRP